MLEGSCEKTFWQNAGAEGEQPETGLEQRPADELPALLVRQLVRPAEGRSTLNMSTMLAMVTLMNNWTTCSPASSTNLTSLSQEDFVPILAEKMSNKWATGDNLSKLFHSFFEMTPSSSPVSKFKMAISRTLIHFNAILWNVEPCFLSIKFALWIFAL